MKKLFNYKNVAKVLVIMLILTILCAIIPSIKIESAFAEDLFVDPYTGVSDIDLDDRTRRKNESQGSAQITVFTPGVGGSASHWSNENI